MITVGTYEARTRLAKLLEEVGRVETVTITRHGRPIARVVPISGERRAERTADRIVAAFRRLRAGAKRTGPGIRDLIEHGRR
jgi:prevent-host-death family protein